MKALIIGISNELGHENNVRNAFLTYAPQGWEADILMLSNNEDLINDENVVHVIEGGGFVMWSEAYKLVEWVIQHPEYSLCVFSYTSFSLVMDRITWEADRLIFMPRTSGQMGGGRMMNAVKSWSGENESLSDNGMADGYYKAELLIESQRLTPSYVNGAISGISAHLIEDGLDTKQSLKAIRNHFTGEWTKLNGFGKFADSIPSHFTDSVEPPNALIVSQLLSSGEMKFEYTMFYGQEVDEVRIYRDGLLVFSGLGVEKQRGAILTSPVGSQHYFEIETNWQDPNDIQLKEYLFEITTVYNGVESRKEPYSNLNYTPSQTIVNALQELEEPVINDIKRQGDKVVILTNVPTKIFRKLRANDEWELISETDSLIDDVDPSKSYIYRVGESVEYVSGIKQGSFVSSVF